MRNVRFVQLELLAQRPDRLLTFEQMKQDAQAVGVAEGAEEFSQVLVGQVVDRVHNT